MKLKSGIIFLAVNLALGITVANAGGVEFSAAVGESYQSVVVKMREGAMAHDAARVHSALNNVLSSMSWQPLDVAPLFGATTAAPSEDRDDPRGLRRYYRIVLSEDVAADADRINSLMVALAARDDVELVYPDLRGIVADTPSSSRSRQPRLTSLNVQSSDYSYLQDYLYASDAMSEGSRLGGVDFHYASRKPGGQGEAVKVVIMDRGGWDFDHPDLRTAARKFGPYVIDRTGTATAGIIAGTNDGSGVTGIANKASVAHASVNIENFMDMSGYLKRGDVLAITYSAAATPIAGCVTGCTLPMEYMPAWFDAIRDLTDRGVVVVESAGDSGIDLDHPDFRGRFDRAKNDSGAILAGGLCASDGRRSPASNYGARVDSSSWSCDNVVTATFGLGTIGGGETLGYTDTHGGTVAAAAIVAGAAASASGYALATHLPLTGIDVRKLLTMTGTAPEGGEAAIVGTQPDLKGAFVAIDECEAELSK